MASCTVTNRRYGYWCGDVGTDATTVTEGVIKVTGVVLTFTASAQTITLAELNEEGTEVTAFTSTPSEFNKSIPMFGARFEGLSVALSHTDARCIIVTE